MKTILITGGAGFIGSNFINYLINNFDNYYIINFDALTYAGNLENLKQIEKSEKYEFIRGNICNFQELKSIKKHIDIIINFAAETHVDRSILNSEDFINTNIKGTHSLLEFAKEINIEKFIQISTDEVYGDIANDNYLFTENTPIRPSSPYSASKASADILALSYKRTYNMPITITRCSNNYGPYQFPEKLIPLVISNALNNKKIPVYGDGENIRDWIYVEDHCRAIHLVLEKGQSDIYNIGVREQKKNIEIVKNILDILNKPYSLIEFVKDRPGHDKKYAIDPTLIEKELQFEKKYNFQSALEKTVNWYLNNTKWLKNTVSGEYRLYYEKNYKNR